MEEILGWGTAGGIGILLAGLGVFFWGLQFLRTGYWGRQRWTREGKSKKKED